MEKIDVNFKLTFVGFGVLAAFGLGVHYLDGPTGAGDWVLL
jgi:hypothetical protein